LQWEVNLIHSQDIQIEKAPNINVEALATPPPEQQTTAAGWSPGAL
jgi:hypothetical protein